MRIIATGLRFPEGPVVLPDGSIVVVEVERGTLSRIRRDGRVEIVANLGGGPNGAALGPDGRIYVCNNGGLSWIRQGPTLRPHLQADTYEGGSIDVVDLATGKFERLYDRCGANRLKGPNDIVFDRQGGFWFTDIGKRREREVDLGFVYWARDDGSEIREVAGGLVTPNGIGLSPNGGTLYVAETIPGRLWAWDVVAPGELRKRAWPALNGATLVAGAGGQTRFDSLAVAASGNICVAALEACAIIEITADGSQVQRHPVPDLQVTNLCFGGSEMRTAFVTLSYEGRLVALDWHEPGLKLNYQS
jgi:gluconolactonase